MATGAVIIERPNLDPVGMPIVGTIDYEINREINAAGAWAVSFSASQQLAAQIKTRWRLSIVEDGRPGYLLYRGVILDHSYRISADGTAIVSLQGMTRLYTLMDQSTHQGLAYDGTQDIEAIANDLTGETVTAPASASERTPKIRFDDTSKLDALLRAAEIVRYNVRETLDEDGFELVAQDDVPDSGFRFVNVTDAGPELESAAANGMGLIAGAPVLGYAGKQLANRVIPIGVEWDGAPLLLNQANENTPYAIQTGVHPNGLNYYYIEDQNSIDEFGLVELQYVRSDVKNPSDDAVTRLAAANVLYAVAAAELMKRKSEVISFGASIANGYDIDALPGDRVRVQFRGVVQLYSGAFTYRDVDQDFLIVKRRDASTVAGVRDVAFTLTAPEVPLIAVNLPDAVAIPPPPGPVAEPPRQDDPNDGADDGASSDTDAPGAEVPGGGELPGEIPQTPEIPFVPPDIHIPTEIPGTPYEPCCVKIPQINEGAIVPETMGVPQGGNAFSYSATQAQTEVTDTQITELSTGVPNNSLPYTIYAVVLTRGLDAPEVSSFPISPGASSSSVTYDVSETAPPWSGTPITYAALEVYYISDIPEAGPVYFTAKKNGTVGDNSSWTSSLGVIQSDGEVGWLTGDHSATNVYSAG